MPLYQLGLTRQPSMCTGIFEITGGTSYMQEKGTKKIGSHIMNLHIKRPWIPINQGIGSFKKANLQSHIREIADKKTAYNEVRLYC